MHVGRWFLDLGVGVGVENVGGGRGEMDGGEGSWRPRA